MKKMFSEVNMTWLKVILFAIITGVYTGLVMCIPALEGTSFQDIGIAYEWWVIFAVIVVCNCKKHIEAMLKCFLFFLISQPIIYLTEIALGHLSFDMGLYYYTAIWLPMTYLTLPGGFIASYCKENNIIGAFILGLGNTIQAIMGIYYVSQAILHFPYHLLSAVVSFGSIIIMTLCIQKEKKNRIISLATPVIFTIILLIVLKSTGRVLF